IAFNGAEGFSSVCACATKPARDKNVSAINQDRSEFILASVFRNRAYVQPHSGELYSSENVADLRSKATRGSTGRASRRELIRHRRKFRCASRCQPSGQIRPSAEVFLVLSQVASYHCSPSLPEGNVHANARCHRGR